MLERIIIYRLLCMSITLVLIMPHAFAQQKDSLATGEIRGIAFDSVHNYVLSAATVAVYKNDSDLVAYQLSNNLGEFYFKNLPLNLPLKIVISYTGYTSAVKNGTLSSKANTLNLSEINLKRAEKTTVLDEVIVKAIPPVRMNGDTLEFNADAFKMDPNAVGEDLLRKLPGVVIWGDGSITVNGREVKQLLVDGKPFFGRDPRIATQNIAKDAIDKIQVYQQNKESVNPLDSATNINIKLKKGKNFGHFGKLAAGYGTNNRYETDASINLFNSTTQLGIVGASNNINKTAQDASMLMRNSTYKGVGANIEYQSNFERPGIHQSNAAGITFQKDFVQPDYYKTDRITANYFLQNNNVTEDQQTNDITALGNNNTQSYNNNTHNRNISTSQSLDATYEKKKDKLSYNIGMNARTDHSKIQYASNSITSDLIIGNKSFGTNTRNSINKSNNFSLNTEIKHTGDSNKKLPSSWRIRYQLNTDGDNNKSDNISTLNSYIDTAENSYYNRRYNSKTNIVKHSLDAELGNMSRLFTNNKFRFWDIASKLVNTLEASLSNGHNTVGDKYMGSENYYSNTNLSGNSKYIVIDESPALSFSKSFSKGLANRYTSNIAITGTLREQFYFQKNSSNHSFQNFSKTYHKFTPKFSLDYYKNQFGNYRNNGSLSYERTYQYATPGDLVPLVDSSSIYYLRIGNPLLQPAQKQQLAFSFYHSSEASKNTFDYNFSVNVSAINNYFADSTLIDDNGRTKIFSINLNGYKNITFNGGVNKAFKFKNQQLQLSINSYYSLAKVPGYLRTTSNPNSVYIMSNTGNSFNNISIYYTFKDKIAINISDRWSWYRSKQKGLVQNVFSNTTNNATLSTSVNCTKKLTLGSNIMYSHNTSSGSKAINYTIWNANATYRFLKGNNLELKLSALDLLHQNTGIFSYVGNNTMTYGTEKVLQQYFMLTVSYFPRKFGKNKKDENLQ